MVKAEENQDSMEGEDVDESTNFIRLPTFNSIKWSRTYIKDLILELFNILKRNLKSILTNLMRVNKCKEKS